MSTNAKEFFKKSNLNFGRLLLSLRLADEVSQIDLAKRVGVSRGFICDIEKGRKQASVDFVVKIAKSMGYSQETMIQQIFNDQLKFAKLKLKVKIAAA